MVAINLLSLTVSAWLGMFLLSRGPHPRLRLAGFGLILYAGALVFVNSLNISLALRLLPSVLWVGTILYLEQRITDGNPALHAIWKWMLIPLTLLLAGLFLLKPSFASEVPFVWVSLFLGLTPLIWSLVLYREFTVFLAHRQVFGILIAATIFFGLGEGLLLFPIRWIPQEYVLPAIGVDLLLLGFCIAWFDAFDEGEAFLPDMIRSFVLTSVFVAVFAGQIGFVIVIHTGLTEGMRTLLTTTILASVFLAVFGTSLQDILDGVVFSRALKVREARRRLAIESDILPRKDPEINLSGMNENERSRITRRALSHFGDLTRLAANPLTQLPVVDSRLKARNAPDSTLDRAVELKLILTDSILKLKPPSDRDFDVTDEWRFYNALFFPYVAGLKPYSRSHEKELLGYEKDAVEWFQAFVPERTLHNWQNAAAKLIANDLWEHNFHH